MGIKFKDPESGQWVLAGSIRGPAGKSAYEYAKDGGYSGTEAEFARMLNTTIEPTDEIYFDITTDGIISLKPEYRGAYPSNSAEYVSDNGQNRDGTQNKELPEEIVIPETVNGIEVKALKTAMFCGNKRVKRIVLPSCIEAIPQNFCYGASNLEEVLNTKNVKTIGQNAFSKSGIRKAYFPGLTGFALKSNGVDLTTQHFAKCANLAVVDLGSVFAKEGAMVPNYCFSSCEKLVSLRNSDGITSIGAYGLYGTKRITNLSFLPNLTSIGNYGMLLSRADYDWTKSFGTLSTSNDINTIDYSSCNPTACNTPLLSTFEQHNPLWANKTIGNCDRVYSHGCATVSAAMIYSALTGVTIDSPEEFVSAVGNVNSELLNLDIGDGSDGYEWSELISWFDAVGLSAVCYRPVSADNVQIMYDALASGALVFARVCSGYDDENHVVVVHGVNSSGELLVVDPSSASREIGIYEAATYAMPIQNFMRDNRDGREDRKIDHFLVVTVKTTT